jgi:hypothetical protein
VTTVAAVALTLAALTGTASWHRRLPLRVRTALVLATVLLLVTAFLLLAGEAGAAGGAGEVGDRLRGQAPRSLQEAVGWLLVGWLAAAGGGPLAEVVLRMASGRRFVQALRDGSWRLTASDGSSSAGQDEDDALEADQDAAAQELRGGAMIGVLERLAVAGALLAGASQGLALVVAVKALGRYPELRTAGASERFIIGTLVSLLWAAAAAGTGLLLLA